MLMLPQDTENARAELNASITLVKQSTRLLTMTLHSKLPTGFSWIL